MTTVESLTGTQKVALVLMQMDRARAADVMRQFTELEADEIASEIVRLRKIDPKIAENVLEEVHGLVTSGSSVTRGGRDFASSLLEESFGTERAASVMDRLASSLAGKSFDFLSSADPKQISVLLDDELPQTIALVIGHLRPEASSQVLAGFEAERRADIATALATMRSASPDAVRVVAEALKTRVGAVVTPRQSVDAVGGIQPLVDLINRSAVAVERELLEDLEARDPELAEEVRSRMLTFSDLVRFERRDVQRVLRGIDPGTLAIALKGAQPALEQTIRENISERSREIVDAEAQSLGPVRMSQVEEARATVVSAIRELETRGEITVQRVEEEDAYVV